MMKMSKTINAQVRNAPDAMLVTCDQMVAYALSRVMLASKPLSKDKFLITSIISSIQSFDRVFEQDNPPFNGAYAPSGVCTNPVVVLEGDGSNELGCSNDDTAADQLHNAILDTRAVRVLQTTTNRDHTPDGKQCTCSQYALGEQGNHLSEHSIHVNIPLSFLLQRIQLIHISLTDMNGFFNIVEFYRLSAEFSISASVSYQFSYQAIAVLENSG